MKVAAVAMVTARVAATVAAAVANHLSEGEPVMASLRSGVRHEKESCSRARCAQPLDARLSMWTPLRASRIPLKSTGIKVTGTEPALPKQLQRCLPAHQPQRGCRLLAARLRR